MFEWIKKINEMHYLMLKILEPHTCPYCEDHNEEDFITFNDLNDKLNKINKNIEALEYHIPKLSALINPDSVLERYDERISRVELMLNEFKGAISISRAALREVQKPINEESK